MLSSEKFIKALEKEGLNFFTGVPDSLLKSMCAYITDTVAPHRNIIAANEGGAVAIAAGHYLATGDIPVVYMQNSGEGNAINPLLSLTDREVYRIPLLLLIGHRGKPGVHDEPQHVKQGKVTTSLLDTIGIKWEVLSKDESTMLEQVKSAAEHMRSTGEAFAFVIEKDSFEPYTLETPTISNATLGREEAISIIASCMDAGDSIVSTTGMISRELFEHRSFHGEGHERDFLTVGSMGHASQIALGIALEKPERRIWCLDGDGAAIMHMGSMAIIGAKKPKNLVHVVLNNGAHDSVGGQPTVGFDIDFTKIAEGCGYAKILRADSAEALREHIHGIAAKKHDGPVFLEVIVKKGNRKDLGRPTTTPEQNKQAFMDNLEHP